MPGDYVSELADQAFREITSGVNDELIRIVGTPPPPDALALKGALVAQPDLQAQVASLTGYTPSRWILERELEHVDQRRKNLSIEPVEPTGGPYNRAQHSGLMGLCFSGGGIRSATFNLGVLQGLAELNLLRCFDYLSTVSGGGYIHQWFAAWIQRRRFEEVEKQLIPLPEPCNPGSHPEPIRWLRRYSNYLTPEKGLFTADTWVAIATWLRNTLLNQLILISGLLFLALFLCLVKSPSIIPRHGPAVAASVGTIVFLSLLSIYLLGENLLRFGKSSTGAFGQSGVQRWLVFPLVVSALLLTFLFPSVGVEAFGLNLSFTFLGSVLVLLAIALTITLAGGAPFAFLKSHHRTSMYKSVGEFWKGPKCFLQLKFLIAIAGMVAVCIVAAVAGGAWVAGSFILVAKLWSRAGFYWWPFVLVVEPPLIVAAFLLTMNLVIGLLGRTFQDARREWLARLTAWMQFYSLLWFLAFGFTLFGHYAVVWLWHEFRAGIPVLVGWIMTTLGGLLAGKSSQSSGMTGKEQPKFSPVELLATIAPYVFVAGLLLLVSALAEEVFRRFATASPLILFATCFLPLAIICLLFAWRVDINEFSLHAFYRNRLARCYLGASNIPRDPNPFSGFDEKDSKVAMSNLLPAKNKEGYNGPFPIFCTALNLTFGEDLAWQERKAASFIFTPLYSGYDVPWTAARGDTRLRFNGFVDTLNYAYPKPGIHIDTAAAISGAAVSPNMGYHSSPATAFLMTVFGVRLGWWLVNPRVINEDGTKLGFETRERADGTLQRLVNPYPRPSPHFSLLSLLSELLGRTNDTSRYVYLSDGGHFDNMGLYELVRRRCRYIVICDSESDGDLAFGGIGMAIRKCRIDFGAEIALDLRALQRATDSAYSNAHCVVGTITYPEGSQGVVVYLKSTLTGDEPADILNYKKEHSSFPHDTTLNQWFSESQFESYRRLGHHVAVSVFEPAGMNAPRRVNCTDEPHYVCAQIAGRNEYFEKLRKIWWASTPEMDRFTAAHTTRYEELLEKARTDKDLPGFFDMMFSDSDERKDWKTNHSYKETEYAVRFSSQLIEFVFMVFNELKLVLPEKRNHPYAQGWSLIFTKWAKIDVVQDAWKRYRVSYSPSFRGFVQSDAVGLPDD